MLDQGVRERSRRFGAVVAAALVVLILGASAASAAPAPAGVITPPVGELPGGGIKMPRATWENFMRQRVFGLRVPGGLIQAGLPQVPGASAEATSIRRIAGAQRNVAAAARGVTLVPADAITSVTDPLSPRKAAVKIIGGVGTAVTAAYGVDLIYQNATGHGLAGSLGFGGIVASDATSGSIVCDVQQIFGDPTCTLTVDQSYVPNSDVVQGVPGFVPNNVIPATFSAQGGGSASGLVELHQTMNGPWVEFQAYAVGVPVTSPNGYEYTVSLASVRYDKRPDGALFALGGKSAFVSSKVANTYQWSAFTLAPDANGNVRDHVDFLVGSQVVKWYPPGHPLRPPDVESDPVRTWVTSWECTDGSSGSSTSDPWRESDPEWPAPLSPSCTSGGLSYVLVQQTAVGLDPWTLYEWRSPDEVADYAQQYPECGDASCVLELLRVDRSTGTQVACFDNPDLCAKWFEDPARADNYACTYGGNAVDLRECYVYAPTFDFKQATEEGTYADPADGTRPPGSPGTGNPGGWDPNPCGDAPPFEFSLGGIGYWIAHGTNWALCKAFRPAKPLPTAKVTAAWDASALGWMGDQLGNTYGSIAYMPTGRCGTIARADVSAFGGRRIEISTCGEPWTSFAPVREVIGWGFIIGSIVVGLITCTNTIRVKPAAGDK